MNDVPAAPVAFPSCAMHLLGWSLSNQPARHFHARVRAGAIHLVA